MSGQDGPHPVPSPPAAAGREGDLWLRRTEFKDGLGKLVTHLIARHAATAAPDLPSIAAAHIGHPMIALSVARFVCREGEGTGLRSVTQPGISDGP